MDFFDVVDSDGIVEDHIKKLLGLEDSQAEKLLRRYKEVRRELADRLQRTKQGTFTQQRLRGVMAQVEAGIDAMTKSLQTGMEDASYTFALAGVEDQLKELRRFDKHFLGAVQPINIDAALVAEDTSNFLLRRNKASLDAYGSDLISSLTSSLTNSIIMEDSMSDVVQKLGLFFQGEEWKLHRIARTEFHNIYNIGKINGMTEVRDEILPDMMKTLVHPMDKRTGDDSKLLARKNPIIPINEPFVYTWKGKRREFMAPPDRPNDRAILVPYRRAWDR